MLRIPWAKEAAIDAHEVITLLRADLGDDPTVLLDRINVCLDEELKRWAADGGIPGELDVLYICRGQLQFHLLALTFVTGLPEPEATRARQILDEERLAGRRHHDWSWAVNRATDRIIDELAGPSPDGNLETEETPGHGDDEARGPPCN